MYIIHPIQYPLIYSYLISIIYPFYLILLSFLHSLYLIIFSFYSYIKSQILFLLSMPPLLIISTFHIKIILYIHSYLIFNIYIYSNHSIILLMVNQITIPIHIIKINTCFFLISYHSYYNLKLFVFIIISLNFT